MQQIIVVVTNGNGLHARPAAQFVQKATEFKSSVTVAVGGKVANAKSILQILSLGAKNGAEMLITAEGPDEEECILMLSALIRG